MSELVNAIRINEEIKQVLGASHRINLVALNALLTSRQAGKLAVGFAVVARQLRGLSGDIERAMLELDQVISALVNEMATALKEMRLQDSVERTRQAQGEANPCIDRMRRQLAGRVAGCRAKVEDGWLRLEDSIRHSLRLWRTGSALARNAKVEAAHGGETAAMLRQVAGQIETAVDGIGGRLQALRTLAANRSRA